MFYFSYIDEGKIYKIVQWRDADGRMKSELVDVLEGTYVKYFDNLILTFTGTTFSPTSPNVFNVLIFVLGIRNQFA